MPSIHELPKEPAEPFLKGKKEPHAPITVYKIKGNEQSN